jgi:DNA-binding response OmpR family regulator
MMNLSTYESNSPLVVALVEDDPLLRNEIEVHLKAHDFEVHAVNSATALDDLIARVAFDLFIIDLNLPGEDGLSLCRRLRRSLPSAGIVIMTARVALIDRIAGYKQGGADIYLVKPVAPDELVMVFVEFGQAFEASQNGRGVVFEFA